MSTVDSRPILELRRVLSRYKDHELMQLGNALLNARARDLSAVTREIAHLAACAVGIEIEARKLERASPKRN